MRDAPQRLDSTAAAYARYAGSVRRALLQLGVRDADIADVSHEVFLVVHAKADSLKEITHPELWMREICRRVAAGYRRRAAQRLELLSADPLEEGESESLDNVDEERRAEQLRRALAALDEESRDLLALHEAGELPIAELARMTEYDRKTVRKRLELARRRLAVELRRPHLEASPQTSAFLLPPTLTTASRSVTLSDELQVLAATPNVTLGLCGNIAISVWPRSATADAFDVLIDWAPPVIAACEGRFGYFAIVESAVRPPALPGRRKIVQILETFGPGVIQYATVLLGGAAWIAQPIMSGLMILARPRFPMRFFSAVGAASSWMANGCRHSSGLSVDAATLGSAVETLRAIASNSSVRV